MSSCVEPIVVLPSPRQKAQNFPQREIVLAEPKIDDDRWFARLFHKHRRVNNIVRMLIKLLFSCSGHRLRSDNPFDEVKLAGYGGGNNTAVDGLAIAGEDGWRIMVRPHCLAPDFQAVWFNFVETQVYCGIGERVGAWLNRDNYGMHINGAGDNLRDKEKLSVLVHLE
ncbi:hypothetical protein GALMADRAFT_214039 [Galerina marginata CBS 339.88]|uniref:Uncharacterized protein n=1 Tax=Galerina marginata (strain CBS 339.88) TaxID=685588 RepID=A0A067SLX2_GALM3|nr:hypothetical protein GALMADRAFT_214039 [Galerina marginata CBS 339.88]